MATVPELEAQLRAAKAAGKTNKAAALQAEISRLKQEQKQARAQAPAAPVAPPEPVKLTTPGGATVKDLEEKRRIAKANGNNQKVAELTAKIQELKAGQKEANGITPGSTIGSVVQGGLDLSGNAIGGANSYIQDMGAFDLNQFDHLIPKYDEAAYKTAFDAMYGAATYGLDDQEAKRRAALEQSMADRGIPVGEGNYNEQFSEVGKEFEQFRAQARNQATLTAGAEAQRLYGLQDEAYKSAVNPYVTEFESKMKAATGLNDIGTSGYALAQSDRQFEEDVRQFGISAAIEKRKLRLAAQNQGGGGGGYSPAAPDTSPIVGGAAPGFGVT